METTSGRAGLPLELADRLDTVSRDVDELAGVDEDVRALASETADFPEG